MTDLAFPAHEYLTVKELADLLRLKERKIYDLAASGEVPCSRATGKLLFPAAEIRQWIDSRQSGGHGVVRARPRIVLGSHDPLLDWAIRQSRSGLATYFDGSLDGLDRFARGEGVICGLHIRDAPSGEWNVPSVARAAADLNAVLLGFAIRRRGLVFRKDGPHPAGFADVAHLRLAPRQEESGTQALFRQLVEAKGLDLSAADLAETARTEDDAVAAVRRGAADITFGLESVARAFGLEFLPVLEERFDLLIDRKAWFDPALQRFAAFCDSPAFRDRAAASGGYDVGTLGSVHWNA